MGSLRNCLLALLLVGCAQVDAPRGDLAGHGDASTPRTSDLAGDLLQPEADLALCGACDDGIACTTDVCDGTGACTHVPDHGKCADRQLCTAAGCVPVDSTKICAVCSLDADCGLDEKCLSLTSGDLGTMSLCVPGCGAGGACPKGFSCDTTRSACVPQAGGRCCYDGDGDNHGLGAGCLGPDCDDTDATVYPGHAELCDGKDNDCNGTTDEGNLCGGSTCAASGAAYSGTAPPLCTAGACAMPVTSSCGLYTCEPVTTPVPGDACRTSCSGDTACAGAGYCDGAACAPLKPDGNACTRDRMCEGGHCQNGFCCATGDCCAAATDCSAATYASAATCDAPATSCQGHRQDRTCNAGHECQATRVDDDTACGSSITLTCAPLQPQSCTSAQTQTPLACATTCTVDTDCVATAYCSSGTCIAKKPDGTSCAADDQCSFGHHCLGGFCCNATTGSCCGVANDCPSSFAAPSTCDAPLTSCQGHRVDKTCTQSVCGSTNTPDDTACSSSVTKTCGAYSSVACNGTASQTALGCATSCTGDSDCVSGDHCISGTCQAQAPNGGTCASNAQCQSNFCVSGVCCQAACNSTTCDTCGGGTCTPFADPLEAGNVCLDSLPDLGSGAFTKTVQAYLQSATDDEDWYQFYASDASNGCAGTIHVQLTVPAGVDYDVYLYYSADGSCTNLQLLADGLSSTGNEDVTWNEQCSVSDEGWYLVRVKRYSGSSCTLPYTLTVTAKL